MHFMPVWSPYFPYSITSILSKVRHSNTLFLTITFAFLCRPLGALVRFQCGGGGGGTANATQVWVSPMFRKIAEPLWGGRGGAKIWRKNAENSQDMRGSRIFARGVLTVLNSIVRLFADDTIAYLVIVNPQDAEKVQDDLTTMGFWEVLWKMKFHATKWNVIYNRHWQKETSADRVQATRSYTRQSYIWQVPRSDHYRRPEMGHPHQRHMCESQHPSASCEETLILVQSPSSSKHTSPSLDLSWNMQVQYGTRIPKKTSRSLRWYSDGLHAMSPTDIEIDQV